MSEQFGPQEWITIGGSTSTNRRLTLEAFSRANGKPIDELWTLLRKGELDPYSAANKMIIDRLKEGLARSTVGMERGFIKNFYEACEIPFKKDLFKRRVTKVPNVTESEPGTLSEDEIRVLFTILEPEWQAMISFAISVGCRPGELFTVKTSDLDLSKNPVYVKFSAGHTKTNKFRYSFLATETIKLVKPALGKPNDLVFDFLKPSSFYNCLRSRLKRVQLTKPVQVGEKDQITKWTVHPHTFRSINKAISNRAGFDPFWTEKLVGHETVQAHYASYEEMAESWLAKVDPRMRFL
jgi:integrase